MTSLVEESRASGLGARRPRIDASSKVTGTAAFAADVRMEDLLHARMVLSDHAHAKIISIDKGAALEVPGVHAVLVCDDLPIRGGAGRVAEPLARDEVVFAGQPVALVLADSEAHAEDGAQAVFVEYGTLPEVVDLRAGIDPASPLARLERVVDEADVEMHGAAGGGQAVSDASPCRPTWSIRRCSPTVTPPAPSSAPPWSPQAASAFPGSISHTWSRRRRRLGLTATAGWQCSRARRQCSGSGRSSRVSSICR